MTAGAEYRRLSQSLEQAGVIVTLPELHGGMCGAMCIGGRPASGEWLEDYVHDLALDDAAAERVDAELDQVELTTWKQLSEDDFEFEPLLPDDDAPLEEQVAALAAWCHGFLAGLGGAGLQLSTRDLDEGGVREIVADFAEISRAGLSEEERADRDEAGFALAELKEYVRVGAQLVFEAFAEERRPPAREIH